MPLKLTGLRTAGLVATRDCAAFSTSPLETAQRSTLFLRRADPQSRPPSKTQTSTTPLVTRCTGSRRLRWHIGHQRPRADSRVRALAANIHGVLGQEFLSHFDYLLDFAGHRLVFGGPVPDGGSRAVMNLVDGRPTVETDRGKLVLDSGTETAILFGASSTGSARRIATASGSASVSAVQNLTNCSRRPRGRGWPAVVRLPAARLSARRRRQWHTRVRQCGALGSTWFWIRPHGPIGEPKCNYLLDSGSPRRVDPCGVHPRRRPGRPASRRTGRPPRSRGTAPPSIAQLLAIGPSALERSWMMRSRCFVAVETADSRAIQ